jgi:hypothetical protein
MARVTKLQAWENQSKFHELLRTPEFHRMKREDQAKQIGVTPQTLYVWLKDLKDDDWLEIRDICAKKVAKDELEIDNALTERAKTGDPKSVELWKELFKGWSRKNINENINKNGDFEGKPDEEIELEMLRKADPEKLRKVLGEKKAPGVVGEEKVENG